VTLITNRIAVVWNRAPAGALRAANAGVLAQDSVGATARVINVMRITNGKM
jgi:hypothetical protein